MPHKCMIILNCLIIILITFAVNKPRDSNPSMIWMVLGFFVTVDQLKYLYLICIVGECNGFWFIWLFSTQFCLLVSYRIVITLTCYVD